MADGAFSGGIADNVAGQTQSLTLPAGTRLYVRLVTAVSTKTSHLRDTIKARVVREVLAGQAVAVPLGAVVQGRIEKLIPSSSPTDRARVLLRFNRLEVPGQSPIGLIGRVTEVENARESVLPDGIVQGLLARELPISHLESALGKLGTTSGDLDKMKDKALGKSDTSIDYPSGTDLVLVLEKPLAIGQASAPAVPDRLGEGISGSVERLLSVAPQRVSSKDGKPGDPLNLVVIGNAEEIRRVFREAGWVEAEKLTGKSLLGTVRAVASEQGYGSAPVSQLYLFGRAEDLAFEKSLNTFMKRHHLRLWRSPETTADGREIWLGAATHDIGLDVHPGVISHAIDPDLDDERAKVGADLLVTGWVARVELVTRPNPLSEGMTATGGTWKTDGRLLAIELKSP